MIWFWEVIGGVGFCGIFVVVGMMVLVLGVIGILNVFYVEIGELFWRVDVVVEFKELLLDWGYVGLLFVFGENVLVGVLGMLVVYDLDIGVCCWVSEDFGESYSFLYFL